MGGGPGAELDEDIAGDGVVEKEGILANDSMDPGGNDNLTSERTGIKMIPRFESAAILIKGSSVEIGPTAAAPAPTPVPIPLAGACPCL